MNSCLSFRRARATNGFRPAQGQPTGSGTQGFTIIEVMMAATILVVGFIGMIQAITIGSEMMATARRQTLANQIITHETEKLRLQSWTTINALPAGPTTLGAPWNSGASYVVADLVIYGNAWYRCKQANSSQTPSGSSSYWGIDSPPYTNLMDTGGNAIGTTFTLTRTATDIVAGELREVQFTIQWTKGGTSAAAAAPAGSWLDQLAFFRASPIARTYTRRSVGYFGKYGLNLNIQRS